MSDANLWVPVASSAIVAVSAIIGSVVTQVWTSRRDERGKALEAETQRRNQSHEFQRKTLLQLQVAVQRFARASGAAEHHFKMEYRKTGAWPAMLPDEMNENYYSASMNMLRLANRILDKSIRERIELTRALSTSILIARSQSEAQEKSILFGEQLEQLNGALGQLLRQFL